MVVTVFVVAFVGVYVVTTGRDLVTVFVGAFTGALRTGVDLLCLTGLLARVGVCLVVGVGVLLVVLLGDFACLLPDMIELARFNKSAISCLADSMRSGPGLATEPPPERTGLVLGVRTGLGARTGLSLGTLICRPVPGSVTVVISGEPSPIPILANTSCACAFSCSSGSVGAPSASSPDMGAASSSTAPPSVGISSPPTMSPSSVISPSPPSPLIKPVISSR